MKKLDITPGMRYGRLVVLKDIGSRKKRRRILCLCDCGNTKEICLGSLACGLTKSCGCLSKEEVIKRQKKHGMAGTRPYNIWMQIKARCNNKNSTGYKHWGGRGITYDKSWDKFENFWKDMESGYTDDLSIDRIDNNRDYCKENCKWSTRIEQNNNQRTNHPLTLNGETHTLTEWSRIIGIKRPTLSQRARMGWDDIKILTTPVKRQLS